MTEKKPTEQSRCVPQVPQVPQPAWVEREAARLPRASRLEIDRQLGRHLVEAQRKEQNRRTIK